MEIRYQKRFADLSERAYAENRYVFTEFLGMAELDTLYEFVRQEKTGGYEVWGGYEGAERQMVRFGSREELGYEQPYPIVCIKIEPLLKKFADEFSHRDFLGAVMNLGIERDTLGDILLKDKEAYLFVKDTMASYILEHLEKVRHTHVKCSLCEKLPDICKKEPVEEEYTAASDRIDAVLCKAYSLSRSQSLLLFQEKKVYVNGRGCENNSYALKEKDVVTVRGYGKFSYDGILYENKKGRLCIRIRKYV